jgi:hypothetical protein
MEIDAPINGANLSAMQEDVFHTPYSQFVADGTNKGQIRIGKPVCKAIV